MGVLLAGTQQHDRAAPRAFATVTNWLGGWLLGWLWRSVDNKRLLV